MTGNAKAPRNVIFNADCINVMQAFDAASVDFILTDPPYVTRYRARDGRTVANDDNGRWLRPAFRQMHRVLKDGGFCVSFYGWNRVDLFMDAWRAAGFRIVGHLVFRKCYASSTRFLRYEHEQAYLLAKGNAARYMPPISLHGPPYSGALSAPESTRTKEDSMCAERRRARKGRPRHPVPETLPDDLYDYAEDPTPTDGLQRRRSTLRIVDVETLPVIDDWPERVPVTEAEIDIFERYFGDVLDRLFGPIDVEPENEGLQSLSSDDNSNP